MEICCFSQFGVSSFNLRKVTYLYGRIGLDKCQKDMNAVMADNGTLSDVGPSAEQEDQQPTDIIPVTVTQDNSVNMDTEDVPAAENLTTATTIGEASSQSVEDPRAFESNVAVTAAEVVVVDDNVPVIFGEGDVIIADGAEALMNQQDIYIEAERQQNIDAELPDIQNVPINEPEERADIGMPNDEQLPEEVQNDQQQQHQDVSPSSDSVEQFGSRQADQELQVVPDSSTAEASDRSRFFNENLHEAMDSLVNRQSPATLGVQMVPTSSNDGGVIGVHTPQEFDIEQEQIENDERHQVASSLDDSVQNVIERQTVPVSEASAPAVLGNDPAARDEQQALYAFQENEDTYEVCVTIPTADDNQMQEIPIDLQGWTDLRGQSLVAVAEDGTTIPLTIVRQGSDVELSYGAAASSGGPNDVEHILQQLAAGSSVQRQQEQNDESTSVILNVEQVPPTDPSNASLIETSILPDDSVVGEQLANLIHIPDEAYISGQAVEVQLVRETEQPTPRKRRKIATAAAQKSQVVTAKPASVATSVPQQSTNGVDMMVELSNTTPSAISPENMQALIEILQSLPATARGQTIQIILQTDPLPKPADDTVASDLNDIANMSVTLKPIVQVADDGDVTVMTVVKKINPKKIRTKMATIDIAIQVTPEFIESEQNQQPASEPPREEETSRPETDIGIEVAEPLAKVAKKDALSEDEKSRQIMAAIMESSRKRRAFRKKNSKQIVTVEEQWVTDPKPGVSYYAVVDYLSELDQDGFSSATEMKRPEAMSSAFMEDHLELQNVTSGVGDDLAKNRSILESTIDSSTIVSPFRRQVINKLKLAAANSETIDLPESLCESGVTLQEKSFNHVELNGIVDDEQPPEDEKVVHPNRKPKKKRLTKKQSSPRKATSRLAKVRYEHKCGYCGYDSADKILVVEHCLASHPDLPMRTLSLLPQTIGRTCPYCLQHFEHTEFFAHMRFAHSEVHPYKCGYCDFMGRDRNQIRHHIQKKHRLPMKVINLLDPSRSSHQNEDGTSGNHPNRHQQRYNSASNAMSEGEESVYEYRTDEEEMDDIDEDDVTAGDPRRGLTCPECKKTFKTLKYLKTHIKVHQPHRYQCGYCSFYSIMLHQVLRHCQKKHSDVDPKVLTKELEPEKNPIVSRDMDDVIKKVFSLNTRLPRDPDQTKWMRKWFCPHCDYTCQFGASYRRHLRMHANILPYKCNYCSFKGRERYYVRRHILRMHPDLPGIVVENNPENCAHDTSSDEGFQEKGLRRKRHRRAKESIHAVVPLDDMNPDSLQEQYQQQPARDNKPGIGVGGRWTSDADSDAAAADLQNVPPKVVKNRAARFPRVSLTSGPTDIKLATDGDVIVCRACHQKVAAKGFQQHAKNHFKKVVPLKCAHCNYMSVDSSSIEKHSLAKHQNLPFGTEECHLASLAPRDFVALIGGDVRNANNEEPPKFTCPLCQSLVDYDEDVLSGHFYSHFEYFPFKCSLCDHQNVSEEKVREHAVVHGGPFFVYETHQDKPEGLEDTIQQFLREGQELVQTKLMELMEQRETETDPNPVVEVADDGNVCHVFVCPVCELQMELKAGRLRRHLHDHYSYKPFKCGHCRFVSSRRSRIRRHSVKEHPSGPPQIEASDKIMPEDLSKMLREIDRELKVIGGQTDENDSVRPTSEVGKAWMEKLSTGMCPWCDEADFQALDDDDGGSDDKLRGHVLNHFGGKQQHLCAHCHKSFNKKRDAVQHIVHEHPGLQIRISVEVSEDVVRQELRSLLASNKKPNKTNRQEMDEASSVTDNDPKPETKKDVYDFDDNDIVTVEGVLLTRTFRSETEVSDDESDGDEFSETDSDDSDLLIGDVDPQLVLDVQDILKQPSFLKHEPVKKPEEASFVQIFVCGYCDFFSEEQDVTKAHTEENHLRIGLLENNVTEQEPDIDIPSMKEPSPSSSPPPPRRRVRCRGGAIKRSAVKTRGTEKPLSSEAATRRREEHDEELQETMENIIRLVQADVSKDEIVQDSKSPQPEEETIENIINMVQSVSDL